MYRSFVNFRAQWRLFLRVRLRRARPGPGSVGATAAPTPGAALARDACPTRTTAMDGGAAAAAAAATGGSMGADFTAHGLIYREILASVK